MAVSHRWRSGQRLNDEQEKQVRNEANFWKQILRQLTLANMCLAFRGHHEPVNDGICEGFGSDAGAVRSTVK